MRKILLSLVATLLLVGCTLVAPYDQLTDSGISQLQKDTESLLTSLDQHHTPYSIDLYIPITSELKALQTRANAIPTNSLTVQELANLAKEIDELQQLHKIGLNSDEIKVIRDALDRSYDALLKLEIAKKRGAK